MNVEKIRNLTDVELAHQQRDLNDQLFKLKFQLKMGQTESLKKIRDLKKDIARMKTVQREKQIAGANGDVAAVPVATEAAPKKAAAPKKKAAAPKKTAAPKKRAARKQAATEKK